MKYKSRVDKNVATINFQIGKCVKCEKVDKLSFSMKEQCQISFFYYILLKTYMFLKYHVIWRRRSKCISPL